MGETESLLDIKAYMGARAELVNAYLARRFAGPLPHVPQVLLESMRYSLTAGGKRLRPALAFAAHEALGGRAQDIVECASALEAIHTYSLIHDDLPAMDDDDLRRGKPTNHKIFGEAVAILAGDGLLTEAFLMIMEAEGRIRAEYLLAAIKELALASGPSGMVGGQVQDILSEDSAPDPETLEYIHSHKTGALIAASVRLGGILIGAPADTMDALTQYGRNLGLAFQIVDDILDVKGDEALLGKPVGSDEQKKKMTYPSLYGIEASMQKAGEHVSEALGAVEAMDGRAGALREIAGYIIRRSH